MNWISVKERLPPEYSYVIVCEDGNRKNEPSPISIAHQYGGEWKILNDEDIGVFKEWTSYMSPKEITHWMPLPKGPCDE